MDIYQAGYINAANGSRQVEGIGTRWLTYAKPGDTLFSDGDGYIIESIDDNHLLTLGGVYLGGSVLLGKYRIEKAERIESLAEARQCAAAEVDVVAGRTRLKYITVSPGQEATYTAKLEDARSYIAAGYPADSTPFVWIHAEALATGATSVQVADLIVYTAGLWSLVGAKIEGARQAAKQAINASANTLEIDAAVEAFEAAMNSL